MGAMELRALLPLVFHLVVWSVPWRRVGRVGQPRGGARDWLNKADHAVSHGQVSGRCSRIRRAEDAILAGMLTSFRRIVAVVAEARTVPVIAAAVRVRLNAMTARTSHAAFAVKMPEGR